jgi:hypothetical protein
MRDLRANRIAAQLGEKVVIAEFLLTMLLPLVLIAVVVGLERLEEDLDRVAPRRPPRRPVVDEREDR